MKVEPMDKGEEILSQLSPGKSWDKRSDGWWLEIPDTNVEKMASLMSAAETRLVTMTACVVSNGEFRIIYHWDLEGRILSISAMTRKSSIPSITTTHPASDWMEREIHDYFAVQFTGRELAPLYLSPEDSSGIFLDHSQDDHKEGKGKER